MKRTTLFLAAILLMTAIPTLQAASTSKTPRPSLGPKLDPAKIRLSGFFSSMASAAKVSGPQKLQLYAIQQEHDMDLAKYDISAKRKIDGYNKRKERATTSTAKASIDKKIAKVRELREKRVDKYVKLAADVLTPVQRGMYFGPKLYSAARKYLYGVSLRGDQPKMAQKICADIASVYIGDPSKKESYVLKAAREIQSKVFTAEQKYEYRLKKKEAEKRERDRKRSEAQSRANQSRNESGPSREY